MTKNMVEKTGVPGWTGELSIVSNSYDDEYSQNYAPGTGFFVTVGGCIWTANLADAPWKNAVRLPGSGDTEYYYVKIPLQVTKGGYVDFAGFGNVCMGFTANSDGTGWPTYGTVTSREVYVGTDGCLYLRMFSNKAPSAVPYSVIFNLTMFLPSF